MTMITPSYLGETIEYSSLHACRSTLEDPTAVAAADFNHDGKMDLAVLGPDTTASGGTVDIFLGNGNGTFARPPMHYHLFSGGPRIIATDVNGDGWADLIVTTTNRVAVLINRQDGTFAKPVYYSTGNEHPSDLAIGDFNNDGVTDLAIANGRSGNVSVLLGNKNVPGTFGPPSFFPTGGNPVGVTVGDFNHDGNLDLAVINSQFQGNTLAVLLGDGDGTFHPPAFYAGANFSDAVVAGNFSNGPNLDLITGSFDGPLKLYAGNGDGTFATPVDIPGGQFTQQIVTADLNGDGLPDLIVTPYHNVRVLLNSTGSITPPPPSNGLDKTIGAGGTRSYSFYTPEGTFTTITLSGPGSAVLRFASSSTISIPNGRGTRRVTALILSGIAATGTSAATSMSITTAGGSRTVTFDSITTDGAFGSIQAPRANLTGPLSIPGGARQISLLSANNGTITLGAGTRPSLSLQQMNNETINSAVPINQISVRLDAGVALTAPSLTAFSVGGSLLNSTIHLTATGLDLTKLLVGRGITSSSILTAGGIGSVEAGNMLNSSIDADVALLAGESLPSSATEFTASASIQSVSLRIDTRQPSFANSTIVAFQEGTMKLGTIQTANGGTPFGLGAHFIRILTGTDLSTHRAFTLSKITSTAAALSALAAQHINPQDFNVSIV